MTHRVPAPLSLLPLALGCTLALAACQPAAPDPVQPVAPAATSTGVEAAGAAASQPPADPLAGADVVVDLRQPDAPRTIAIDDALEAVLAQAGAEAAIASDLTGRFTAAREQRIVLLLPDGARAIAPTETPAQLLVLEEGAVVSKLPLKVPYLRIVAVTDLDGDGLDDVVLRSEGMQMGEKFASIHAISLAGARTKLLQRFDEAYSDDCGSPRTAGEVRAAVIVRDGGKLAEKLFWAPCAPHGDPPPAAFKAVGAPGSAAPP